jgi:DMSO/TMAO reductase YedYZ heme-binding membrane subunit
MKNMINGWRLTLLAGVILLAIAAGVLALTPDIVDGVRAVIRWTARCSLVLFLLAFTASAFLRLAPNPFTAWQRRNRRYLGVAFAISHLIHLAAILAFASLDSAQFWQLTNLMTIWTGGLAYVFIVFMAATSIDRMVAAIGSRAWQILHTAGAWYIWVSFMVTFGKRAAVSAAYAPAIVLLIAALIIKILATFRARKAHMVIR